MGIVWDIALNSALALKPVRILHDRRAVERGYDKDKDTVAYVRSVFDKHAALIRNVRQISGEVLEIGPGGNVGAALLFLAAGASTATCIDNFPWNQPDLPLYNQLVDDPALYLDRLHYRAPEEIETTRLPDASFDIIYSQATLEHVAAPGMATRQIARLLRPGGVTSHHIDLRDHRDFARPLDFLRYPDSIWRAATSRRAGPNRWRKSDWVEAFEREGLNIVCAESTATCQGDEIDRAAFCDRFRQKTLDDLASLDLLVSAIKPVEPTRLSPSVSDPHQGVAGQRD